MASNSRSAEILFPPDSSRTAAYGETLRRRVVELLRQKDLILRISSSETGGLELSAIRCLPE
jgi:hypothetical protein